MMRFATLIPAAAAALAAGPALAHHPLAGQPMETFQHGVLSGVGHPLLGFDHLFFIVAVGVAAAFTGRRYVAPLAYVGAMILGAVVCIAGMPLPLVEPAIALSLLALGALIARGEALSSRTAMILFAVAGLFHGWAFGGSIAGQEGGAAVGVVAGYLLGLAGTQWAVAVAAGLAVTAGFGALKASDAPARLAGASVAGAGAFLVLEVVEGAAFSALGLG